MFCPKCGKENEDGAIYCEACGCQLQNVGGIKIDPEKLEKIKKGATDTIGVIKKKTGEVTEKVKNTDTTKVKSGLNKWKGLIIAGFCFIFVIVAGVITLSVIGNNNTPQKTLEKFFGAYVDGDYDKMYSYFFEFDSDYIDANAVASHIDYLTDNSRDKIRQYNVAYYSDPYDDNYGYDYYSSYSDKYRVEYLCNGASRSQSIVFDVVTVKGDGLRAFRKYKVSLGDDVVSNVSIYCMDGTEVLVDGKKLDNAKDATYFDSDNSFYELNKYVKEYTIDAIFSGEHKIELIGGGFENKTYELEIYDDDEIDFVYDGERELSDESFESLKNRSEAIIKAVMYGAVSKKNFKELGIKGLTTHVEEGYQLVVEDYEDYTSINISNIYVDYYEMDGSGIFFEFRVDYDYTEPWNDQEYTGNTHDYIELMYIYSTDTHNFELVYIDE